jgi:hypothetical protein
VFADPKVGGPAAEGYGAGALVAVLLVVAGGDDIESSVFGLQPAKNAKSGTNIRIFFIVFSSSVLRLRV